MQYDFKDVQSGSQVQAVPTRAILKWASGNFSTWHLGFEVANIGSCLSIKCVKAVDWLGGVEACTSGGRRSPVVFAVIFASVIFASVVLATIRGLAAIAGVFTFARLAWLDLAAITWNFAFAWFTWLGLAIIAWVDDTGRSENVIWTWFGWLGVPLVVLGRWAT